MWFLEHSLWKMWPEACVVAISTIFSTKKFVVKVFQLWVPFLRLLKWIYSIIYFTDSLMNNSISIKQTTNPEQHVLPHWTSIHNIFSCLARIHKSIHTGNTKAYEGQAPRGWNCNVVIIDCHWWNEDYTGMHITCIIISIHMSMTFQYYTHVQCVNHLLGWQMARWGFDGVRWG